MVFSMKFCAKYGAKSEIDFLVSSLFRRAKRAKVKRAKRVPLWLGLDTHVSEVHGFSGFIIVSNETSMINTLRSPFICTNRRCKFNIENLNENFNEKCISNTRSFVKCYRNRHDGSKKQQFAQHMTTQSSTFSMSHFR